MRLDPDMVATLVVTTIKQTIAPIVADVADLREQVTALAERPPVPGPVGPEGPQGAAGAPGADGLGFDDLDVSYDGDRTITLAFERGGGVYSKAFPIELPIMRYRGAWATGTDYRLGDVVMHGGSAWHCSVAQTTVQPLDDRDEWRLMVRRGRDGRDRTGARA